jgi:tricorn protease-like protein
MSEEDLNKCKDFLDYFNVKWDGDRIKLTSGGNCLLLNPNTEKWKEFLGYSVNGIARLVAKELDKEVYWDEEDY